MARALCFAFALALAPPALAQSMQADARPAAGTLSPGEGTLDASIQVRATTEVPVDNCFGYVDPSAPDVVVDWQGGDLEVSVQGDFDPTLAVYSASGQWLCDDDTYHLLPVIALDDAPAGRYAVWVGSFNPGAGETARVTVGARPPMPTLDASAAALAGTIEAAQGFEGQGAIEVAVRAGGADSAERIDLEGRLAPEDYCSGFFDAGQPTATVAYDGAGELGLTATSPDTDLVMMVLTPDGTVRCNDDFHSSDPALGFAPAASGDYAVWVGTFGMHDGPVAATLVLSETAPSYDFEDVIGDGEIFDESGGFGAYSEGTYVALDLGATPASRVRADPDEGGSAEVSFRAEVPNPVQGASCAGYIEQAPTAAIELSGDGPFALTAHSDDDLTLTVRTPGGNWFCSDDADGLDPGIQIDAPEAGTYLAWVGAFGERDQAVSATLAADPGEIATTAADFGYGFEGPTQSEGTYDGTDLDGPPLATVAFEADGPVRESVGAGGALRNPVAGEVCGGFVTAQPSLEIDADGPFTVSASGDQDLTLTVRSPDGAWTCSDDAQGTDPEVTLSDGPGAYSVWVGTYYRRTAPVAASVLLVTPPPPPPPPPPAPMTPGTIRG